MDAAVNPLGGEAPVEVEETTKPPVKRLRLWRDGRVKPKTFPSVRLSQAELLEHDQEEYPVDIERPVTRGDCKTGNNIARPCPWVSCRFALYLDVNPSTGAVKLNFPHLEPHELAESCALDVADRGGITLEEVGATANLTRERIRQVEVRGLAKLKAAGLELIGGNIRDT